MPLGFGSHTSGARFDVLLDKFTESGPGIVAMDMVMLVAENAEPEVIRVRNIDEVIMAEESVRSNGPARLRLFLMGNVKRVIGKCGQDIRVKLFLVHDDGRTENWSK